MSRGRFGGACGVAGVLWKPGCIGRWPLFHLAGIGGYRYDNAEVTRLLKETDEELDEGRRADLFRQAQEIMAGDLPLIPMYQRPEYYAFSENLVGPEVNPTLAGPCWNMGEWELKG